MLVGFAGQSPAVVGNGHRPQVNGAAQVLLCQGGEGYSIVEIDIRVKDNRRHGMVLLDGAGCDTGKYANANHFPEPLLEIFADPASPTESILLPENVVIFLP